MPTSPLFGQKELRTRKKEREREGGYSKKYRKKERRDTEEEYKGSGAVSLFFQGYNINTCF